MTLLQPGDEEHLPLGRIRLDSWGCLCDRLTGYEVIPRGEKRANFREYVIERVKPDHYRIRTPTNETILLRYTNRHWYYREASS